MVVAVEYPGYSIYKEKASEDRIMEDAQAVLDFIIHQMGVDRSDIILLGASLGTVVSVTLASNNPGLSMLVYLIEIRCSCRRSNLLKE